MRLTYLWEAIKTIATGYWEIRLAWRYSLRTIITMQSGSRHIYTDRASGILIFSQLARSAVVRAKVLYRILK